jgi:putative CocE/NonD family hydrolase
MFGGRLTGAAGLIALAIAGFAAPGAQAAEPTTPPCKEIGVKLPDGVHLDGWFRPANGGGRRPVLWTMTPYSNSECPQHIGGIDDDLARRFNVIRLSYRGTGASEGISDEWGPQTRKDILDVGDWIAAQPWAGGLVPTGASAEGAWITYALQHPGVIASVWEMSCADPLRGCIRTGGQLAGGAFILTAGILEGWVNGIPQRLQNGFAFNPTPPEQWTGQADIIPPAYLDDYSTPFWRQRLGLRYLRRIHAPVMYTTDLYDYVPEGMYVAYENTDPRYRWLNLGLGHNSSAAEWDPATKLHRLVERPIRRFLERFAFGARNGFEQDPRVTLVTNLGTVSGYEAGKVLVRHERDWPLPATRWTRLYLGPGRGGGSLNGGALRPAVPHAEVGDTAPMANSAGPKGELRTALAGSGQMPFEIGDQFRRGYHDDLRPDEAAGLTYTTAALPRPVELSGPIVLRVFAASTASDFDWQVRLTDVHPDGRSSWISDGQLRASLREVDPRRSGRNRAGEIIRPWYTYRAHQPVPQGKVVKYLVEMAPTSNVFAAGDRIRVDIQPIAENYLDSARTGGLGTLRVLHGGRRASSILLPLIPHRCQLGVAGSNGVQVPRDCAGPPN